MEIIAIIIGIAFLVLLSKAILETIWGTLCLIFGLFLHAIAYLLDCLDWILKHLSKNRDPASIWDKPVN